jgi:hypothetical protein
MKDIYITMDFDCIHTSSGEEERIDREIGRLSHKAADAEVSIFDVRNYPETTPEDLVGHCREINRQLRSILTPRTKKSIKIYITGHGSSSDSTIISHSNGSGLTAGGVSALISMITNGLHFWHRHEIIQIKLNMCGAGERGDERHSAAELGCADGRRKSFAQNLAEELQVEVKYDFIVTANKGNTYLAKRLGYEGFQRPLGLPVGMDCRDFEALKLLVTELRFQGEEEGEELSQADETLLRRYIQLSIRNLSLPFLGKNSYIDLIDQVPVVFRDLISKPEGRRLVLLVAHNSKKYIFDELILRNWESLLLAGYSEKIKIHRRGRELITETKSCNAYESYLFKLEEALKITHKRSRQVITTQSGGGGSGGSGGEF